MGAMKRRMAWLAAGVALWCAGAAQGRDGFALKLYGELAREEKGNFVCSPHGVAEVLGMAEAGSAGRTRAELRGQSRRRGWRTWRGISRGRAGIGRGRRGRGL